MKNTELRKKIEQEGLHITQYIRYVYKVKNEDNAILMVDKLEHSVPIGENLGLGWQPLSEIYWGVDMLDGEVMVSAGEAIQQYTNCEVDDLILEEMLMTRIGKEKVLNLVFSGQLRNLDQFEFWSEEDGDCKWEQA